LNNSHPVTTTAAYLFQELYATDHPPLPAASPATLPHTSGLQANRQRRSDKRVEERMQIWTPDFIRQKQEEDSDIKAVLQWFKDDSKPDWDTVRAQSLALKAYWHQLDSLKGMDGKLYKQLLLTRSLKSEFLDSVHTGLAGHMEMTKMSAHVTKRAYWYQWRRDVNKYVKRCPKCSTYNKGRILPRQGNLVPLLTGAPVERWACDLAGPFPKSTKGHVYILTAICVFSKYIVLVPLWTKKL